MAGEVIRHESYSQSADVYSFAVVLWQLITREEPFQNKSQIEAAAAVAFENARPPFPDGTPSSVIQFIETCWSNEPDERLPFEQIVPFLRKLETTLTSDEATWINACLGHPVYRKPPPVAPIARQGSLENAMAQHNLQRQGDEKPKGFRKLFNRKSVHF